MKRKLCAISILAASALLAQPTSLNNASVSGVVRDAGTGQPLAHYNVSTDINVTWLNDTVLQNAQTKQVKSVTDEQGRYKLSDLPPGPYRIDARSAEDFTSGRQKRITLSGQDLDGLDFNIAVAGKISGRVVDENKEAVPDMTVYLISKEYYMGALGYFIKGLSKTDDRGEYTLPRVIAGHAYYVMAEQARKLTARSDAPLDPKLRRRVSMRTYHPNSPNKEGAAAIVLRPREHRERVDIEVKKSANYCIEGTLMSALGAAAVDFSFEGLQPSFGMSTGGGPFGRVPTATTGPDGKFRVCDVYPGSYRLMVLDRGAAQQPSNFAVADLVISDRDLQNVKIAAAPGLPLEGEVAWDGAPPETPVNARVSIILDPLSRNPQPSEKTNARSGIPGTFSYPGLVMADYGIRTLLNAPGLYVKDVTYGSNSVLNEPLRLGNAMQGAGLRVTVARDGATITARVADKDGNPLPAISVLLMPTDVKSEAILQKVLVMGETDQLGIYTSHTLAPGKYYAAATAESLDATTESIGKLWRSRIRFKEVELTPGGSAQVTLEVVKIE